MPNRITVTRVRKYDAPNINQELQWIGSSLGLFNLRDKDSSCFRVFITLVRTARQNKPLTSDEIAEKLRLSRGTVVHHLTRLMEAGIVLRERKGYLLRETNLQDVIKDVHRDMEAVFAEMLEIAQEADRQLGS